MQKIFFCFYFLKKGKIIFLFFQTFGFWGGSMAGENVQFEEGQDEFCVKNLKRGSNIQKLFF